MNRTATTLLMCLSGLLTVPALSQSQRPPGPSADDVLAVYYSPVDHAALGIVGNGIHGIVGNGILQRISPDELVLNDRVYLPGAGVISVTVDLEPTNIDAIGPGHVIEITAQTSAGSAIESLEPRTVVLDSLIRGQAQMTGTVDSGLQLTVLDQTVPIQSYTAVYDGADEIDLIEIQTGNYVRLHGWLDNEGAPVVTRIDRLTAPPAVLEVSGPVTAVNIAAAEFEINDLGVDFSSASFLSMSASDLSVGQQVEVTGALSGDATTFQASTVRPVTLSLNQESKQLFDLLGVLSAPAGAFQFTLNGLPVDYNAQTVFDRGTPADLLPGAIVEVDGRITANGRLIADVVRFNEELLESEIRIFSTIESVDHASNQLEVLGLPVSYSAATRLDDHSDSFATIELIEQLDVGDYVEVRGYDQPDGQNQVAATRIIRESAGDVVLRARVDSISGSSLVLLGRLIETSSATEYEAGSGAPISEQEFFATAVPGSLVKATVIETTGGGLLAVELSIEDD